MDDRHSLIGVIEPTSSLPRKNEPRELRTLDLECSRPRKPATMVSWKLPSSVKNRKESTCLHVTDCNLQKLISTKNTSFLAL